MGLLLLFIPQLFKENVMRLQQSVPSIAAYKRALRSKLGLRGKKLEAAARMAAKNGSVKQVLQAAAYA